MHPPASLAASTRSEALSRAVEEGDSSSVISPGGSKEGERRVPSASQNRSSSPQGASQVGQSCTKIDYCKCLRKGGPPHGWEKVLHRGLACNHAGGVARAGAARRFDLSARKLRL